MLSSVNTNGLCPLEHVACCREVPDYHESVQQSFAPELRPGHLLDGRFRLVEPISRSGMAVIYRAQDERNQNQQVAVKMPHLRLESDPGFFSRFQREEEIGRRLNHPYVLKFLPVEGEKSRPYIVTEYLRGCTLAHLMNAMRPFPEKDALKIASLVCEALQHMPWRGREQPERKCVMNHAKVLQKKFEFYFSDLDNPVLDCLSPRRSRKITPRRSKPIPVRG